MLAASRVVVGESAQAFFGGRPTVLRLAAFAGLSEVVWRKIVSLSVVRLSTPLHLTARTRALSPPFCLSVFTPLLDTPL